MNSVSTGSRDILAFTSKHMLYVLALATKVSLYFVSEHYTH